MYALALILRAQLMLRFTDTYGPLPIGVEEDANAYSSQEKVYSKAGTCSLLNTLYYVRNQII